MLRTCAGCGLTFLFFVAAACGGQPSASRFQATPQAPPTGATAGSPLTTKNMPSVVGPEKTCVGPRAKTFDIDVIEVIVFLGRSVT